MHVITMTFKQVKKVSIIKFSNRASGLIIVTAQPLVTAAAADQVDAGVLQFVSRGDPSSDSPVSF